MSAAARAEARRKAILNRATDRLAKLTTSARGEDAPAYLHDDPPLPNITANYRSFIGEESISDMPTPNRTSVSPSPTPPNRKVTTPSRNADIFEGLSENPPDPSVWLPEQRQQFMQALMNASSSPMPASSPIGGPSMPVDPSLPPIDNPFAALLAAQAGSGFGGDFSPPFGPGMTGKGPIGNNDVPEPTKLQKAMPLLHILAMWCLLAYFVLWAEPHMHSAVNGEDEGAVGLWRRWAELGRRSPLLENVTHAFKVQIVPFFWALTTLQIALHSLRIFSGFDSVQPPILLAMALPHLPPPFPSIIVNSLKYMQMGSLFLDDLAGLVVGIGFIVYFSGWFTQS